MDRTAVESFMTVLQNGSHVSSPGVLPLLGLVAIGLKRNQAKGAKWALNRVGKRSEPTGEAEKAKSARMESTRIEKSTAAVTWPAGLCDWLETKSLLIACTAILVATLRIVATYPVFNHTVDEPTHIACGMEWLSKGSVMLDRPGTQGLADSFMVTARAQEH
jgi:hypothetical protein